MRLLLILSASLALVLANPAAPKEGALRAALTALRNAKAELAPQVALIEEGLMEDEAGILDRFKKIGKNYNAVNSQLQALIKAKMATAAATFGKFNPSL